MMKNYLLVASLCLIPIAYAQESTGETQSIRCSALAHIHTVITTPPEFNEGMTNSGIFNSAVFAAFRESRTGSSSTNGDVNKRRDTIEAELRNTWKSKPEVVISEMALCNSWRANYAGKIQSFMGENRSKAPTPQSIIDLVGSPPTFPAAGQVDKWRPIVSMAFRAWAETGSQTAGEARDEIRKKLQDILNKR